MNSSDRDIERLLRKARVATPAPGACLDAEQIAAWADGGLTGAERERAETHVSQCARCQTMLAAVVESAPVAEAYVPLWRRWHLEWLVPLTAAAAAAVLWMVVPGDQLTRPATERPSETVALAPPAAGPSMSAPAPAPVEPAPPPPQLLRGRVEPEAAQGRAPVAGAPPTLTPSPVAGTYDSVRGFNAQETRATAEPVAAPSATPPPPAAMPPPAQTQPTAAAAQRAAAPATAAEQAATPSAQSVSRGSGTGMSSPAGGLVVGGRGAGGRGGAPALRVVTSPDPLFRWRFSAAGSVERTTDGAATWQPLAPGVQASLTAGSSPSPTVCWLVGSGGVVLLTTDGQTWRRITFPDPLDLTAIQATDARTATVTAIDGRRFETRDGGTTWTSLLQDF